MVALPSCSCKQSIEWVAMSPVHHAGVKASLWAESSNHAALQLQQAGQSVNKGHHLRPFAEPYLLGNLEEGDRADKHGVSLLDGGQGTWRETVITRKAPGPSVSVEQN